MTIRPSPLRVSASLAILFFDWVVYAITMTHVRDWASATVFGACSAALAVALIEQWNEAPFQQLLLRAAIAGAIVAVPLPLLGSAVSVVFLTWSIVAYAQSHHAE